MPAIEQLTLFEKYGLPGLVIAALFALIVYLHRSHREDRREWLEAFKITSQNLIEVTRESNEATKALTVAVERQSGYRRATDYDDQKK